MSEGRGGGGGGDYWGCGRGEIGLGGLGWRDGLLEWGGCRGYM